MKWNYIILAIGLAMLAYWVTLPMDQFLFWDIPNPLANLSMPLFIFSGMMFLLAFANAKRRRKK